MMEEYVNEEGMEEWFKSLGIERKATDPPLPLRFPRLSFIELNSSDEEDEGEEKEDEDTERFIRERNLLLLSAIQYEYGSDYNKKFDWKRISSIINDENMPVYKRGLSAEYCEQRYNEMMENGFELGFKSLRIVEETPKIFSQSEKRHWIVATTCHDLHLSSAIMDKLIRVEHRKELLEIAEIEGKLANLSPDDEQLVQVRKKVDKEYEDLEEDVQDDLIQKEVLYQMTGMEDALVLLKFCDKAARVAADIYPTLMDKLKQPGRPKRTRTRVKPVVVAHKRVRGRNKAEEKKTLSAEKEKVSEEESSSETIESSAVTTEDSSPPKEVWTAAEVDAAIYKIIGIDPETAKDPETVAARLPSTPRIAATSSTSNFSPDIVMLGKDSRESKKTPEELNPLSEIQLEPPNLDSPRASPQKADSSQAVPPTDEEKIGKVTRGRNSPLVNLNVDGQASTPVLRSRRVTTPTATTPTCIATPPPTTTSPATLTSLPEQEKELPMDTDQDGEEEREEAVEKDKEEKQPSEKEVVASPEKAAECSAPEAVSSKPSEPAVEADQEEETFETPIATPETESKAEDEEIPVIDITLSPQKAEKSEKVQQKKRTSRTVSVDNSQDQQDEPPAKRVTRRAGITEEHDDSLDHDTSSSTEEKKKTLKRLTRGSLKLFDQKEEDDLNEPSSRAGSEKAGSESSYNGKERQRTQSTRASRSNKADDRRTKSASVAESEHSENEPITRATRSRTSTSTNVGALTETQIAQPTQSEEESAQFRKSALAILEKLSGNEGAASELDTDLVKNRFDLRDVKVKVEAGEIKSMKSLEANILLFLQALAFSNPEKLKTLNFYGDVKEAFGDDGSCRLPPVSNKTVDRLIELVEMDDSSPGENAKPTPPTRRKRKRSTSETSEDVSSEKRRVTRTSASASTPQPTTPTTRKQVKHPISPDILMYKEEDRRLFSLRIQALRNIEIIQLD